MHFTADVQPATPNGDLMKLSTERLNKILDCFWIQKGKNSIYHLGRCADFAYSLKKFLGTGELYLVGVIPNSNLAWHVVVRYGNTFWDIHGQNTLDQIRSRNPIVQFCDDNHTVKKASPQEIQHITKLLNRDFVIDTLEGLKKAEKEVR